MRLDSNQSGAPNYFPNSFSGPQPSPNEAWHVDKIPPAADVARFSTADDDNFTQVGDFYRRVLDEGARARLVDNIAGNLSGAMEAIQKRAIANFAAADADFGRRIAAKVRVIASQKPSASSGAAGGAAAPLNPPRPVPKLGNL
jgi:catalase